MAANGGGPPFTKKEEEQSDPNPNSNSNSISNHQNHTHNDECSNGKFSINNSKRGVSIAERRAAKCGFNASNMNAARFNTAALSAPLPPPLFTVPAGLSPSALLDSPIMLPNAQAQLSPTTGTFQFPSPNHESLKLKLKLVSNGEHAVPMETCSDDSEAPRVPLSEPNKFMHENKPLEEFECPRNLQEMKQTVEYFDSIGANSRNQHQMMLGVKIERGSSSSMHITPHQKSGGGGGGPSSTNNITNNPSKNSEDGFYWRKYGQKHVKGSEYPRSYYKCTNTNCPVTKKVERSHDGHITEIVYKGSHNHPNPQPLLIKREIASETMDFAKDPAADHAHLDVGGLELEECHVASPESVSLNEEDANDNGECEAKKRKRESSSPGESSAAAVARSTREPKVVVQIESEIDILDDGYRWRKYGQKVVKGNPNPRSYYKCTTPGCTVRKHVERASNDIKSVMTTYEGKHNHEVPSSKTGSSINNNSDVAPAAPPNSTAAAASSATKPAADAHAHALKPPGKVQVQDLPLYLDRKPILNYNELMRSNLPANFSSDLNFGPSSLYPLPFPPFHSLPYSSFLMNAKTYPASSKLYPMMAPDYMPMPSSQMNAAGSSAMPLASTYHYSTTTYAAHHQVQPSTRAQETRAVKPKEEQIRDEDELYDTCLSIPNQGNGAI